MTKKEKEIQRALGTLNIPDLTPIDLRKVDRNTNTHPDLKKDEIYLVYLDGEHQIGYVDSDIGEFCVGVYTKRIEECAAIWHIEKINI